VRRDDDRNAGPGDQSRRETFDVRVKLDWEMTPIDPDRVSGWVVWFDTNHRHRGFDRSRSLRPRQARTWDVLVNRQASGGLVLGDGLLLLGCGLLRRGLRRRGLGGRGLGFGLGLRRAALLGWLGLLHRHRSNLVPRHTRLRPTGMNRPVPAPIHTKSLNFWKTNFPQITRISRRSTRSQPYHRTNTVETDDNVINRYKCCKSDCVRGSLSIASCF
jgi:hypothetical protein